MKHSPELAPSASEPSEHDPPLIGLYVAVGGGIGALARFGLGGWVTTWAGVGFPWATFAINVIGSGLLGFLHRSSPALSASPAIRAFLTIGLCGGFTTFSTLDLETLVLLQQGRYLLAATYSVASVITCIAGVLVGMGIGSRLIPAKGQAG